jgi:uncharacterized protein (TIGR03118 family)
MRCFHGLTALSALAGLALLLPASRADSYYATYLVSNRADLNPQIVDPLLRNPWGIAFSATGPFWISNEGSDSSTVYSGDANGRMLTKSSTEVTITGGNPTGIVSNSGSDFAGAHFIFANFDGTIDSWVSGTASVRQAAVPGAAYTGLAIGFDSSGNHLLYAANVQGGTIDVFDTNFQQVFTPDAFMDPSLDPKFSPFNVQNIDNYIIVTYVNTQDRNHDGAVNVFNTDGVLLSRFARGGTLNGPWGVALAPDGFGQLSNTLLIGNFGDGRISAFDPHSRQFLGLLKDDDGNPWVFERLWALQFGNGGSGGDTTALYITAGINHQQDGLFASLRLNP